MPGATGARSPHRAAVTLLFTSYLVVTAVAMLITNWVSSRVGAKQKRWC